MKDNYSSVAATVVGLSLVGVVFSLGGYAIAYKRAADQALSRAAAIRTLPAKKVNFSDLANDPSKYLDQKIEFTGSYEGVSFTPKSNGNMEVRGAVKLLNSARPDAITEFMYNGPEREMPEIARKMKTGEVKAHDAVIFKGFWRYKFPKFGPPHHPAECCLWISE